MKKLLAGTIVALALPVSAALAADHPSNAKSPAKACAALRDADGPTVFKAQYRNFGQCVSEHAKARTRTPGAIKAQENAAKACKAARANDADAFAQKWGTGRNGFGKCVSATAKAKHAGREDTSSAGDDTSSGGDDTPSGGDDNA
jgi:hypothetical protein